MLIIYKINTWFWDLCVGTAENRFIWVSRCDFLFLSYYIKVKNLLG